MPVRCVVRRNKFRIVEPDGTIAKNSTGGALDGGGHETRADCNRQARAINANLNNEVRYRAAIQLTNGAELEPNGKPIEIIYVHTFTLADRGRVLEVTEAMLDQMVINFQALEDSGRLPISVNHNSSSNTLDSAKAVGWITRVYKEVASDRISLMAEVHWTDAAMEAITQQEFRFISAEFVFNEINTLNGESVGARLCGAALTNIPAIPALHPIALTQDNAGKVYYLNQSLPALLDKIAAAFYEQFWDTETDTFYIWDIREEDLIVQVVSSVGEALYAVKYSRGAGPSTPLTFQAREQWVEVEHVYQPVAANSINVPGLAAEERPEPTFQFAADSGIRQDQEDKRMELEKQLREVLGLDDQASPLEAVQALSAQLTAAQEERDQVKGQMTALAAEIETLKAQLSATAEQKETAQESLTVQGAEVESLTTKLTTYEAEAQRLAAEVAALMARQRQRETEDRIHLAIEQGRTTPAELDAREGFLRQLAGKDPSTFETLMAIRSGVALTTEIGQPGASSASEKSLDQLFELVAQKVKEDQIDYVEARRRVMAEHPEFEPLTRGA